jgi:hypothetical protein
MKAMSPSQVKTFVINVLSIREIPYISGPPGIGKSDICAQVAEEFNLELLTIHLSQKLPEDLTGIPILNEARKKAEYTPFDTFPLVGDPIPEGKDGWLIHLDELPDAPDEVFSAIYSLLLGHKVGDKHVHPKALIVAAGNRSTDSAIARPLPDTLITRMFPCEMKVSSKDWLKWAKSPEVISNASVISFIEKYPDMLNSTIDPSKREELESYNNPRSWGKIFKVMNLHEKQTGNKAKGKKASSEITNSGSSNFKINPAIASMLFSGVGIMAGKAFQDYYDESLGIPYPWEIAQTPSSSKIPDTHNAKAEIVSSLVEHFMETTEQSRDAILSYMKRMESEYSSLFAQLLKEKLGSTSSDTRLLQDVKNRLNIPEIGMEVSDENVPFYVNQTKTD